MDSEDFSKLKDDYIEPSNKNNQEPFASGEIDYKDSSKKYSTKIIIGVLIVIVVGVAIFLIIYFVGGSGGNNNPETDPKYYEKIRLNNWYFGSSEKIQFSGEEISMGILTNNFYEAPEDFYVCTAMGGLSGHTNKYYYETNLKNVNKTQFDVDWFFRSSFEFNTTVSSDNLVLLHINGINYKSDVFVDGKQVAKRENIIGTFVKYTLDITRYLNLDSNIHYVVFQIARPHNQWGGKSYENETDLAISFVDWNPEAPDSNMGIWQPVDVEIFGKKQLTVLSSFVRTEIIEDKNINLEIVLHIKNWEYKKILNTSFTVKLGDFIEIEVKNINFERLEEKQIVLNKDTYENLTIKYDPNKLWWPYQMGNQNLHDLTIKFQDHEFTQKVGLKQIESEYDSEGKKVLYKINKKNILLKGAGWTPDLFLRQSPENYYTHIKYVRDMGLNVIRLEGKSEGEEFYEYCDKLGVLVIPGWNCADAWQRWGKWDEAVKALSDKSVISQIRKLSPHPSVIIFILGSDYGPTNGVEERWRKIFAEEKWPNEILSSAAASDPEDPYPTGVKMSGPYSWVPPNYFYLQTYRTNEYGAAFGFLTEGGPGENPLRRGSIEKIYDKENLENYEGNSWKYHCGNKVVFGDLSKIIKPINERLGDIKNFDDFLRKSSAIVYEGHRAMFEAYECFRYNSTGVIQWMLNNAWPSNIWHLYDYFMTPTPAYFATKKATEKIHAMYNYEDKSIYLTNNYFFDFDKKINLDIYIISFDGITIIEEKNYPIENLKSDEIRKIEELTDDYGTNYIIHLEYSYNEDNKDILLTNTYFLNKEMDVMNDKNYTFYNIEVLNYTDMSFMQDIPKVNIKAENLSKEEFEENGQKKLRYNFRITNEEEYIALLLEIKLYQVSGTEKEIIVPIIWSDNYFSIRGKNSYETYAEFVYDNTKDLYLDIVGWNCELNIKLN